jgi:hypothetical protein
MKICERVKVQLHYSRPWDEMEVSSQFHAPVAVLPVGIDPGAHWIVGCMSPRYGLGAVE